MTLDDCLREKEEHTPKDGTYNLVGIDMMAIPGKGESLYLVGNFKTRAEAERKKAELEKSPTFGDTLVIYG